VTSTGFQRPAWIEERPYQREAIESWVAQSGQGILNMATGTGKTVTALLAAATVVENLDGRLTIVIAVPYQHLVEQWADDIRDFNADPVLAYQSRASWQEELERQILEVNLGSREVLVVVTTHRTFASDAFQAEIDRVRGGEVMLVADEVHHLGAPHTRDALPESVALRLGLSATPERWYDDEGTAELFEYFGEGVVYEYSLQDAIAAGSLCEYYYVPHIIELTDDETSEYLSLSRKIAKLASRMGEDLADADLQSNTSLKHALFKRARLVGTAENKLERLLELVGQQEDVDHTLVYCGDGSVEAETDGETMRHVEATEQALKQDMGIDAELFTAEVSQSDRQRLLDGFEAGEVPVLVAIRCLDEGVDVPATRQAYILASSSNPRQFIQRRGRILRTHPGKRYAVIHDFIVKPPAPVTSTAQSAEEFSTERSLVRKELQRVNLFAEAARNHPDADVDGVPTGERSLQELKRDFNLLDL
jgi:DNA phosphorothioation system restriction enzyme